MALERKKKKTIQVYQIITKAEPNETKNSDGSVVHEELVEITEVDEEYMDGDQVYVEEGEDVVKEDTELINDELEETEADGTAAEPLDAVSFLLEKKELFQSDKSKSKGRRSHKCEVCEKSFMRKSNLVDHLRMHANVRWVISWMLTNNDVF